MALLQDINIGAIEDDPKKQIESVIKQLNEWGRVLSNEDRTNITKDDAGDQRLLIGFQENGFDNGNVGVKMSQSGVDVQTATDDQLIFSTDFNLFKIVATGTLTVTKDFPSHGASSSGQEDTDPATVDLTGYGFTNPPIVLVAREFGGNYSFISKGSVEDSSFAANHWVIDTWIPFVTTTELNITLYRVWATGVGGAISADTGTYGLRYYILQETAS